MTITAPNEPAQDKCPVATLSRASEQVYESYFASKSDEGCHATDESLWAIREAVSWLTPRSDEGRQFFRETLDVFHMGYDKGSVAAAARMSATIVAIESQATA
jgi:hypothetical protein